MARGKLLVERGEAAPRRGERLDLAPEVPFAYGVRLVARVLQQLRHQLEAQRHSLIALHVVQGRFRQHGNTFLPHDVLYNAA